MDNLSSDADQNFTGDSVSARRHSLQLLQAQSFFSSPVASLLEYTGLLRLRSDLSEAQPLVTESNSTDSPFSSSVFSLTGSSSSSNSSSSGGNGDVAIRIIGPGQIVLEDDDALSIGSVNEGGVQEMGLDSVVSGVESSTGGGGSNNTGNGRGESSYQRFDIQQLSRWAEQILPLALLLLVVFIRQQLQGMALIFMDEWLSNKVFDTGWIMIAN